MSKIRIYTNIFDPMRTKSKHLSVNIIGHYVSPWKGDIRVVFDLASQFLPWHKDWN